VTDSTIPEQVTVVSQPKKGSEPAMGGKSSLMMTESDEEDEQMIEEAKKAGQGDDKSDTPGTWQSMRQIV
jgi:hypothetical protein